MDATYLGQILLSIVFFAPGLVLLAALLFVGLAGGVERLFFRPAPLAAQPAPQAGPIVSALQEAVAGHDEAQADRTGTRG